MSTIVLLSALAGVQLAALASPGPNILVIGQAASGHSRTIGLFTALGVATGATAWAGAALVGLSLLQTHGAFLYPILRILGGCYLVWLGLTMWRGAARVHSPGHSIGVSRWQAFRRGALVNLANPGTAVFFTSVFAALLPPGLPLWTYMVSVAIIAFNSVWFHCAVAVALSAELIGRTYRRTHRLIETVGGGLLIVAGTRLVLTLHEG
jgi:threonine/homoserine/homoserine lactone efflux protein